MRALFEWGHRDSTVPGQICQPLSNRTITYIHCTLVLWVCAWVLICDCREMYLLRSAHLVFLGGERCPIEQWATASACTTWHVTQLPIISWSMTGQNQLDPVWHPRLTGWFCLSSDCPTVRWSSSFFFFLFWISVAAIVPADLEVDTFVCSWFW